VALPALAMLDVRLGAHNFTCLTEHKARGLEGLVNFTFHVMEGEGEGRFSFVEVEKCQLDPVRLVKHVSGLEVGIVGP